MKSKEDYIDEEIGWRIQEERKDGGVTYIYTNQKTGHVIKGSALESYYQSQSPRIRILSYEKEQQEISKLREAGVLGEQIARRIMNMVHKLHKDGYGSLYLDSGMAFLSVHDVLSQESSYTKSGSFALFFPLFNPQIQRRRQIYE